MLQAIVVPPRGEDQHAAAQHRIATCVDRSEQSVGVVRHARAVARALDAPMTLLRVIETAPSKESPTDPIDWIIRRREALSSLEQLARAGSASDDEIEVEVVEGQAADQICRWARSHGVRLIALGVHGESDIHAPDLGDTARRIVDHAPGSVLLVPSSTTSPDVARYRRILVPVDGSSRAESVLPLAVRLAEATDAELLLAHVVPVPELTETGPLEMEAIELQESLVRRNERVGQQYLKQMRARIARNGLKVRTLTLRGDDVRTRLTRLITDERVDLVVLSALGHSSRVDVSCGSVAAHLIGHAMVPLLIVRNSITRTNHRPSVSRPELQAPRRAIP